MCVCVCVCVVLLLCCVVWRVCSWCLMSIYTRTVFPSRAHDFPCPHARTHDFHEDLLPPSRCPPHGEWALTSLAKEQRATTEGLGSRGLGSLGHNSGPWLRECSSFCASRSPPMWGLPLRHLALGRFCLTPPALLAYCFIYVHYTHVAYL